MSKFLIIFLILCTFLNANQIEELPETIEEFVSIRNEIATTPEGGAFMFLVAMKIFSENEELGVQCLTVMINIERLGKSDKGYKGYTLSVGDHGFFKSRKRDVPYLVDSYFNGSSPENSYTATKPYEITTERSKNNYGGSEDSGRIKIFVSCSGADSARPITLIKNSKGLWKAHEWSSVLVGIRPPQKEDDGDDL